LKNNPRSQWLVTVNICFSHIWSYVTLCCLVSLLRLAGLQAAGQIQTHPFLHCSAARTSWDWQKPKWLRWMATSDNTFKAFAYFHISLTKARHTARNQIPFSWLSQVLQNYMKNEWIKAYSMTEYRRGNNNPINCSIQTSRLWVQWAISDPVT
jgi:hypothetical protein